MDSMMPKDIPWPRNSSCNQGRPNTRSVVSVTGRGLHLLLALDIVAHHCAVLFVLDGGRT
jgi:hypothetical protein